MTNDTSTPPQCEGKLSGAVKKTWTVTKSTVHEIYHEWTIEKFSYLQPNVGSWLKSSDFTSETNDGVKFYLKLWPHGYSENYKTCLSLYLIPDGSIPAPGSITIKYVLSIIDASGNATNDVQLTCTSTSGHSPSGFQFIKRDFLEKNKDKLLPDDKLVLRCIGSYSVRDHKVVSGSTEAEITMAPQLPVTESEALDDFGTLLETRQFSDVILDVCGTEFHAHKAILSARSTVFAAMFNNEMKEQKENRATIIDTDPQVFGELLTFIYTDKAPKLENIAAKLICVADKYAVLRLKKMCTATLSKGLSIDNASDTLILAYLHNAEELKSMTLDFICSHAEAVMDTESYKSMLKTHSQLAAKALATIVLRLKNNKQAKQGSSQ